MTFTSAELTAALHRFIALQAPRVIGTYEGITFYADEAVQQGEAWVIGSAHAVVGDVDATTLAPQLARIVNLAPFPVASASGRPWAIASLVPDEPE